MIKMTNSSREHESITLGLYLYYYIYYKSSIHKYSVFVNNNVHKNYYLEMNEKNSVMSSITNSGNIINSSGGVGGKGKL